MPTYVWECEDHGRFETFSRMADKPATAPCPECQRLSRQIPTVGGVHSDTPAWFNHPETLGCLQKPGERPLSGRKELNNYLKRNGIACLG